MARAQSQVPYSCRSLLFFGSKTNNLIKRSSIKVFKRSDKGNGVGAVMGLVSMLIKHVGSEVGIRISVQIQ